MPADDTEISRLLGDRDKRIVGDLRWLPDDAGGHEFVAPVLTTSGELIVRGQRCPAAGTTRFALVLRGTGRIAALDLGHEHTHTGELHFHRWQPGLRDHHAEPTDEPIHSLTSAWHLFCRLTRITHEGHLTDPPPAQETLL
jgi:hypothetical protein